MSTKDSIELHIKTLRIGENIMKESDVIVITLKGENTKKYFLNKIATNANKCNIVM